MIPSCATIRPYAAASSGRYGPAVSSQGGPLQAGPVLTQRALNRALLARQCLLTPSEADHLFRILRHLKAEGKTIILITHKLREIMAVTDAVSVMRRGEMVRTLVTAGTSPAELAEAIFEEASLTCRVRRITTEELGRPAPRPANSVLRSERGAPELPPWREGLRQCLARL